jgi:hypothetical protein
MPALQVQNPEFNPQSHQKTEKKPQLGMVVYMPIIPALRRLRQKDLEFKASLGYVTRPYVKDIF